MSIGGRAVNATPGLIHRRGPMKEMGDTRSLQTGSVSTLSPPIWMSSVECPTHVTVNVSDSARGMRKDGAATGKELRGGCAGRCPLMRSMKIQRRKARNP